ncbi:MAG: Gfo/Idh/MocA family oxidoreductase [Saprospiraceae bacterium]
MSQQNRRKFLKKASLGGLLLFGASTSKAEEQLLQSHVDEDFNKKYGPNDTVRLGFIGCGIQGFANARSAIKNPGVEVVAACDLYTGRLDRMKEVFGAGIFTTRDFREILNRKDIDAVCISTSDHWHDHQLKAALAAGKPVYCEKPMMHHIDEGLSMVEAERKSGLPVQIGSQRASGLETLKAKELLKSGAIGDLILADIRSDRNSSNGAWQYSIPTDAGPDAVDWDTFLGDAPKRPFDKTRFFRWRNYDDYGTGVAGDLFVHLFTALHIITSSKGPSKIYGTGGLRFWKDGRDAPDVTLGLLDYEKCAAHPAFNVQMRVNFVDGSGGGSHVNLIGTEGMMTIGYDGITVKSNPVQTQPSFGGWDSYDTFSEKQQAEFKKWFESEYADKNYQMKSPAEIKYTIPQGFDTHKTHWKVFTDAVRGKNKIVEDTAFGLRAAAPSLATNVSMKMGKPILWDGEGMKLI